MLALDNPWYKVLVAAQDSILRATVSFWSDRSVRMLFLPITTQSISSLMGLGGDSEPVCVDIGGERTYLADSMQFMLEYGCRIAPQGCYYVMPSFRGEATDPTRMNEFFHSEAEIPGTLDDVIEVVEAYLRALATELLSGNADEIRAVAGTVQHLERLAGSASALPRLTFDEASRVVQRRGGRIERNREHGFRFMARASERLLMSYCGGITWLTNRDQLAAPFYQALAPETGKALNADLLIGQGEVLGAGERHATGDEVRAALQRHGLSADEYEWYIAMKDFFPLKTSGFGLGIERFLLWVLDHDDVRDLQLLPRMRGSGIIP